MTVASINGELAWAIVFYELKILKRFKSVSGIPYDARIYATEIVYKGGDRNNGRYEIITRDEFTAAFEAIKGLKNINTNTIKNLIPASLYRQRTPFIGLLKTAGILT